MAQIKSVGAGVKTSGKVGGLVYVHVNGKTFARTLPSLPAAMFKTPEAKKRQALFTLIQWHMKYHGVTIKKCFSKGRFWSAKNNYYHRNAKAFNAALSTLADGYVQGMKVSVTDIDGAIATYAAANPDTIQIGGLDGYQPVFLNGPWPSTITLSNGQGDTTTVVIVEANGSSSDNGNGSSTPGGNTTTEQVTISVAASPTNGGNVSGGGTVAKGTQLTLTATPNSGYTFSRWSDGNTSATRAVTANATTTYTAQFAASQPSTGGGNGDD